MKTLLSLALLLLFSFPCWGLSAKEAEIGKEAYDKITSEIPIYADTGLTDYVNAVGQKLVAHSDSPKENFTFTVLDSPDINAFATPGAYIYINRGLITYLSSEAQLAAVLAHEIAHVTARHHARQKRAQTTSNVAATVLAVLSRSSDVGEATALWGAATVSGYGREMELEADGLGAKFMAAAGYDRRAMIEVISLLKDNERFEKKKARETGREPRTYHGLFATHPRSDQRLQEMVGAEGNGMGTGGELGIVPFRLATDKLVWGDNFQAKVMKANRHTDEQRLFRVDFPQDWTFSSTSDGGVEGRAPDGKGGMKISLRKRILQPPDQFIKTALGIHPLKKSHAFRQYGLLGHTGLAPGASGPDSRLAVIYYGHYAVVFTGDVARDAPDTMDEILQGIIRSFAPISPMQLSSREPQRIHYVKATANTTFAALASHLRLGTHGEEALRLINGYYPRGEPAPGEWIKIIR